MIIDEEYGRDYYQEYKDDLAQGHIYPDGTQREPDEPDYGELAGDAECLAVTEEDATDVELTDEAPF